MGRAPIAAAAERGLGPIWERYERGGRRACINLVLLVLLLCNLFCAAEVACAWMFGRGCAVSCYQTELVDALCLSVRSWWLLGLGARRPFFKGGWLDEGQNSGFGWTLSCSPVHYE